MMPDMMTLTRLLRSPYIGVESLSVRKQMLYSAATPQLRVGAARARALAPGQLQLARRGTDGHADVLGRTSTQTPPPSTNTVPIPIDPALTSASGSQSQSSTSSTSPNSKSSPAVFCVHFFPPEPSIKPYTLMPMYFPTPLPTVPESRPSSEYLHSLSPDST
ncbi:hypothetical protein B0H14DRAFT_3514265 [Mycena olivaceomarginata]|nr:hypothetical protein B0H14DRAFT_3514265 [Mycena olivaceomarginata]